MGSGEMGTPTKTTKTSTPQEQTPPAATTSAMSYQEWATAALQAYYGPGMSPLPPPGYYPSTMGSGPQPHPYMWGAQPLMPPYGTPPPYAAMYHGGMYGHPPMTPVAATSVGTDVEGKSNDEKTKKSGKKSKGSLGSLGMLTGKTGDSSKASGASMNGALSQSGDSGSEGSSDGSEGNSQDELHKSNYDQATSEAQNSHMVNSSPYGGAQDANHPIGNPGASMPISMGGKQVVGAGPLTNLNIGMDYWSGGTPGLLASTRGSKRGAGPPNASALIPAGNPVSGDLWLQDERELKRQRRKQSNRESARRSRLRKQAECEELATKVQALTSENDSLREELNRMTEQCKKLSAENSSLLDQLQLPRAEGFQGGTTENGL